MNSDHFEIVVGEVSDVETRVIVRYQSDDAVKLWGVLRGPYCERAHTLPAEYPFEMRGLKSEAQAIVTDPCLWSPELPHLYRIEVEAIRDDQVVATYHGEIGLRRMSPAKNWDHIK